MLYNTAMKTISLNLPNPLWVKIEREVETFGFAGKSDFLRFLALNYFLQKEKSAPMSKEDAIIKEYEPEIVKSLTHYLKNPKNIAEVIHIEN